MTEGKLVRDLVPDIIRKSGRRAEVLHLSGDELVIALAAKLREEACEAAEGINSRPALIEELADVTEVMSAAHGASRHRMARGERGGVREGGGPWKIRVRSLAEDSRLSAALLGSACHACSRSRAAYRPQKLGQSASSERLFQ